MTLSRRVGALGLTGLAASVWIGTAIAQDAERLPRFPALLADITAPAIDRGIRDLDPPRAPRHDASVLVAAGGGGREPIVDGPIIVKFRPGTTPDARRAILSQVDGSTTRALPCASFDFVSIDAAADPERVAQRLDTQPDVEYAQARYRVYPAFVPNDPLDSRQWNYPAIEMERAWDINPGATSSITVAVLDSSVAYRSGVFGFNARAFRLAANAPVFPPSASSASRSRWLQTSEASIDSSLRVTSSGATPLLLISTATARTRPESSASSPTTALAWREWRSTCASCR